MTAGTGGEMGETITDGIGGVGFTNTNELRLQADLAALRDIVRAAVRFALSALCQYALNRT